MVPRVERETNHVSLEIVANLSGVGTRNQRHESVAVLGNSAVVRESPLEGSRFWIFVGILSLALSVAMVRTDVSGKAEDSPAKATEEAEADPKQPCSEGGQTPLLGHASRVAGGPYAGRLAACCGFVTLNASGPLLMDLVKRHHGGHFPFSSPALIFHAYACAAVLGATSTLLASGLGAWRRLLCANMLCRYGANAALFALGDTLNVMSMEKTDVVTFSLVGKALAIVLTALCSRALLGQEQTRLQLFLLAAITVATADFCMADLDARRGLRGSWAAGSSVPGLEGSGSYRSW
jgi:hypothetical protein